MQVLRFTSPKVDDDPFPWSMDHPLSLAADRHVTVRHGQALHVYDLRRPEDPVVRIPDVVDHGLAASCLVTADSQGMVTRWEPRAGTPTSWEPTSSFAVPHTAGAASSTLPALLLLSASGRYLLVESAPIEREVPAGPGARAYLLDAVTGEVKHTFDQDATWVRGGFACLPTGEEVLFISAEDDMGVQLVACASGQTLHAYVHRYGVEPAWEFCHTDYALTADATRLLTFGCWWGAPFEARIYDATPWTRLAGATPSDNAAPHLPVGEAQGQTNPFPLPLVYRQAEVFGAAYVLPFEPHETRDGTVTSVTLADLADLAAEGAPDAAEGLSELTETDRAIYQQLSLLPRTSTGVVIRRIKPSTGEVVGWSVAATAAKTEERHVHVLPDHRVLLVNERIQIVNGITGEVSDEGPFDVPVGWFSTLPTTSGDTLIVYTVNSTEGAH